MYPLMTRDAIEAQITGGSHLVVVDQYVLKLNNWTAYHPGGVKAIHHLVGRDATDEVNAFHSSETRRMMDRYRIGRIEGLWRNLVPPIQRGSVHPGPSVTDHSTHEGPPVQGTSGILSSHSSTTSPLHAIDVSAESSLQYRTHHGRRNAANAVETASSKPTQRETGMDEISYLNSVTREKIDLDLDQYPSPDADSQRAIVRKYRDLCDSVTAKGLFECNYGAYAIEACRFVALFAAMLLSLLCGQYFLSGCFMGCFWHQIVFTAHDAGHLGITHNYQIDTVIGILVADFLGGLSIGWWKRNHNIHHIVTNSPEHDPDIEHMPIFAVSHRFLQSLRSTYYEQVMECTPIARFILSIQGLLYYPVMALGRFNLYVLSWDHLLHAKGPRKGAARWHWWLELTGQIFFWFWFGYCLLYRSIPTFWPRLVFLMTSHMVTGILHVQITLSHFAMSTADLGPEESFAQRMLRTTMDVDCPAWLDFFHGGLQFQAIHHLFPRMPRHNLRAAQKMVKDFCADVSIPYALYGFGDGNGRVISRLDEVSRQAAMLAKCQQSLAKEAFVRLSGGPI